MIKSTATNINFAIVFDPLLVMVEAETIFVHGVSFINYVPQRAVFFWVAQKKQHSFFCANLYIIYSDIS